MAHQSTSEEVQLQTISIITCNYAQFRICILEQTSPQYFFLTFNLDFMLNKENV